MKRHIVLIEDEPAIRENYRDAFERRGYQVSAYGDRKSAYQVLRTSLPELVSPCVRTCGRYRLPCQSFS